VTPHTTINTTRKETTMSDEPKWETTAEHYNKVAFTGQWAATDSAVTQQCDDVEQSDTYAPTPILTVNPVRRPNVVKRLLEQVATFCNQAKRLWISCVANTERKTPLPHIFLTVQEDEIKGRSLAETVITVEVVREDGKTARAALSIGHSDLHGWYATMTCQKRSSDPQQTMKLTFVDWESVGKTDE
jgi:hypothetical protein